MQCVTFSLSHTCVCVSVCACMCQYHCLSISLFLALSDLNVERCARFLDPPRSISIPDTDIPYFRSFDLQHDLLKSCDSEFSRASAEYSRNNRGRTRICFVPPCFPMLPMTLPQCRRHMREVGIFFSRALTHELTHDHSILTCSESLTHARTHSLAYSLIIAHSHSGHPSLTHLLTHSLAHSLTDVFTHIIAHT